jgi:hypothetical protein
VEYLYSTTIIMVWKTICDCGRRSRDEIIRTLKDTTTKSETKIKELETLNYKLSEHIRKLEDRLIDDRKHRRIYRKSLQEKTETLNIDKLVTELLSKTSPPFFMRGLMERAYKRAMIFVQERYVLLLKN